MQIDIIHLVILVPSRIPFFSELFLFSASMFIRARVIGAMRQSGKAFHTSSNSSTDVLRKSIGTYACRPQRERLGILSSVMDTSWGFEYCVFFTGHRWEGEKQLGYLASTYLPWVSRAFSIINELHIIDKSCHSSKLKNVAESARHWTERYAQQQERRLQRFNGWFRTKTSALSHTFRQIVFQK